MRRRAGGAGAGAGAGAGSDSGVGDISGGRSRRARWVRRSLVALVVALVVPVLGAEGALRLNYTGDLADGTYTRSKDAIWLGHAWVDGRKTDADLTALANLLY